MSEYYNLRGIDYPQPPIAVILEIAKVGIMSIVRQNQACDQRLPNPFTIHGVKLTPTGWATQEEFIAALKRCNLPFPPVEEIPTGTVYMRVYAQDDGLLEALGKAYEMATAALPMAGWGLSLDHSATVAH